LFEIAADGGEMFAIVVNPLIELVHSGILCGAGLCQFRVKLRKNGGEMFFLLLPIRTKLIRLLHQLQIKVRAELAEVAVLVLRLLLVHSVSALEALLHVTAEVGDLTVLLHNGHRGG
jgi:hypothetical protein